MVFRKIVLLLMMLAFYSLSVFAGNMVEVDRAVLNIPKTAKLSTHVSDEDYEIITAPEAFDAVEKALADNNIEADHASITMIPENTIKLTGEDAEKMERFIDALDEIDDVQDVYHNAELPEDEE